MAYNLAHTGAEVDEGITNALAAKIAAWVSFNGTGTAAVNGGFNATLTDNGTGDYTINFTSSMADTNYSVVSALSGGTMSPTSDNRDLNIAAKATGSVRVTTRVSANASLVDVEEVSIAVITT